MKIVLGIGLATRCLGAALAPPLAVPESDRQAVIVVVRGLPLTALFARLGPKWAGRRATTSLEGG